MSKRIGFLCMLFIDYITLSVVFRSVHVTASEPFDRVKYCVQVPHVVLPETIQYKTYTNHLNSGGSANVSQRPATYTAFPSYFLPIDTEFRTINQLYYPVTPMMQSDLASETAAKIAVDKKNSSLGNASGNQFQAYDVPKFVLPASANLEQTESEPVFLTRLDETKNPVRQVSDNTSIDNPSDESETPANSIVFLKSQRVGVSEYPDHYDEDIVPSRLNLTMSRQTDWLERESLFVTPATYTGVTPPTQLGLMQPNSGFQQAQPLPAYGQLCQPNYNYNYGQQQFPPNPYGGMFAAPSQQMPTQSSQYQSLAQLGSIMPVMSGQPMAQTPGYGMAMQSAMQPAMQQQTIGYILLYPQAAQSGVSIQLAGQQGQGSDGASSARNEESADSNVPNGNAMQLQAAFIPASQMPNFVGQTAMPQIPMVTPLPGGMNPYMMNPIMPGGMSPYMTNPYMMNPYMMNPYMMNPMMTGMGGMMPPIIIQMPADSGRRNGGLFARLRAARKESQNSTQRAANSLTPLFIQQGQVQQGQMPASAAYPYGYFGVTASPYQSGNFGGYHDMSTQTVRFPGM